MSVHGIRSRRRDGHRARRAPGARRVAATLAATLCAGLAACEVEWGGGQIALENPAPPPDRTGATEELEPEQIPLPTGPHLFVVRLDERGAARAVPLAMLGRDDGTTLAGVSIPDTEDPSFRARFDSAFLSPGTELDLLARGSRIGTLVLDGVPRPGGGSCASIATGQALLPPGQDAPRLAFAVPRGVSGFSTPRRAPPIAANRSMSVAGPVLAERLIGGGRAFLAQRADITPVEIPGDTLPGMAATYLIADSLAAGPPGSQAVSLFFLARFEPTEGFIPIWEEVRRYDDAADKEAFAFADWIRVGADRIDVLRRYDATSTSFALGVTGPGEAEHGVSWVEPPVCDALTRLTLR